MQGSTENLDNKYQMYKQVIDSKVFPYLFEDNNLSEIKQNYFTNANFISALCVLCFDDEIGQVAENIWPIEAISKDIMKSITGLGFPETNTITEDGELQFIFKIRQNSHIPLKNTSINDQKFYFCYTLFIQKKDINYKRGYIQKSILIISEIYHKKLFFGLLTEFKKVFTKNLETGDKKISLEKLKNLYNLFNGDIDLESNTREQGDKNVNLVENIDSKYFIHIAEIEDQEKIFIKEIRDNIKINMELCIFPQDNNFFENLSLYYVSKILNIWELIITETPLIVQTENPNQCSQIVLLLSSIIFPLSYCGDVRPYFTIYDNDYKDYKYSVDLKNSHSPILGVINPIIIRTLKDWAVLHFDDIYFHENKIGNPTKFLQKDLLNEEFLTLPNNKKKFVLVQNKALIKTFVDYIIDEGNQSLDKLNIYLRMYLIELNNDFMRTFEEYFFTHEVDNIKRIALIKPNFSIFEIFNSEKFLKYLSSMNNYFNLKYVKNKKKTIDLYSVFIKTKCFQNYLKNLM